MSSTIALFYLPLRYYYLVIILFIWAIYFGYIVATTVSWATCLIVLLTISSFSLFSDPARTEILRNWHDTDIKQQRTVAELIYSDAFQHGVSSGQGIRFLSWVTYGEGAFFSPGHAYWYFLEQLSGQRLVQLLKENAYPIALYKQRVLYLICESPGVYQNDLERCFADTQRALDLSFSRLSCVPWQFNELEVTWKPQYGQDLWKYRIFQVQE